MRVAQSLAIGVVALASYCAAQSTVLGFTRVPTSVRAGQAATIEYDAQDLDEPVTITLRKGDSDDLDTIQTLTSDATGGRYTWIPADYFENDDDYALQIQQGREINYSGAISLSGANAAAVSSAQAQSASLSSLGAAITSSYALSSSIASISSIIASYNSSLANLTAPVTRSTSAAASAGTGVTVPRNTTLVTPTLTSTSRTTGSASTTSGQGSATSEAPAASSSGAAAKVAGAISGSSPLALVFCALAGMFL